MGCAQSRPSTPSNSRHNAGRSRKPTKPSHHDLRTYYPHYYESQQHKSSRHESRNYKPHYYNSNKKPAPKPKQPLPANVKPKQPVPLHTKPRQSAPPNTKPKQQLRFDSDPKLIKTRPQHHESIKGRPQDSKSFAEGFWAHSLREQKMEEQRNRIHEVAERKKAERRLLYDQDRNPLFRKHRKGEQDKWYF